MMTLMYNKCLFFIRETIVTQRYILKYITFAVSKPTLKCYHYNRSHTLGLGLGLVQCCIAFMNKTLHTIVWTKTRDYCRHLEAMQ